MLSWLGYGADVSSMTGLAHIEMLHTLVGSGPQDAGIPYYALLVCAGSGEVVSLLAETAGIETAIVRVKGVGQHTLPHIPHLYLAVTRHRHHKMPTWMQGYSTHRVTVGIVVLHQLPTSNIMEFNSLVAATTHHPRFRWMKVNIVDDIEMGVQIEFNLLSFGIPQEQMLILPTGGKQTRIRVESSRPYPVFVADITGSKLEG